MSAAEVGGGWLLVVALSALPVAALGAALVVAVLARVRTLRWEREQRRIQTWREAQFAAVSDRELEAMQRAMRERVEERDRAADEAA